MAHTKGAANLRSLNHSGKHSLLPPRSPFPSIPHSYIEYSLRPSVGPKSVQRPKQGNNHHQRTSSESFALEEQPSWLDELLNEPDTPVRKGGHRRSSSDSFAYVDVADVANRTYSATDPRVKNMAPLQSWSSHELDLFRDARFYGEMNFIAKQNNNMWDRGENYGHDVNSTEKIDQFGKPARCDGDSKHAKQQFAQRSRVRKLQLIAELEKNVQALEADGSEVSAELKFLNQKNLILGMENKALKHRLDSLAQEQLIKCLEQEVLQREIGRLQALYQQQQQPPTRHRHNSSRDLDSQFANLSVKQKDDNSRKVLSQNSFC